jgi:hypothetical protein
MGNFEKIYTFLFFLSGRYISLVYYMATFDSYIYFNLAKFKKRKSQHILGAAGPAGNDLTQTQSIDRTRKECRRRRRLRRAAAARRGATCFCS